MASLLSVLLGLDCLLLGLSDLIWSDLNDTGEREPSCLLRLHDRSLVGEADIPDISLVRLETKFDVSDCAEFCLVNPGGSPVLPTLADMLGWVLGECGEWERRPRPCPIEMGLELLDLLKASAPTAPIAPGAGLADLDFLGVPGVPGGVTPLPFALLAPMTFTSSLTETP